MNSPLPFVAICAALDLLFAAATPAFEIVGTVHIVPAEKPSPQRARPKGVVVSYVSERDPNQVFSGKTDAEGRYRVVLDSPTTVVGSMFGAAPAVFRLFRNYPNPFNPSTRIPYYLQRDARVSLRIYNILGQPVRTLIDAKQPHGVHSATWDGRRDDGMGVGAGVYFARLIVDGTRAHGEDGVDRWRCVVAARATAPADRDCSSIASGHSRRQLPGRDRRIQARAVRTSRRRGE